MKRVISRLRQEDAEAFNDKVAELVTRSVTIVDRRVRRVGELRIARENGDDLGDIDVLVLNRELRLITALETKDVEFARTPVELASEVAKLAHGDHSASHKHDERLAWIRGHVPEILRRYGVEGDSRRWRVKGFIVTSRDLLTPLAIRASIETVSYRRVRDAPESFS